MTARLEGPRNQGLSDRFNGDEGLLISVEYPLRNKFDLSKISKISKRKRYGVSTRYLRSRTGKGPWLLDELITER